MDFLGFFPVYVPLHFAHENNVTVIVERFTSLGRVALSSLIVRRMSVLCSKCSPGDQPRNFYDRLTFWVES